MTYNTEYLDPVALVAWLGQTAFALGILVDPSGRGSDDISRLIAEARRGAGAPVAVKVLRADPDD